MLNRVTLREEHPHIRPALIVLPHEPLSVDIVDDKGELIGRINLVQYENRDGVSVDIIRVVEGTRLRTTAWHKGERNVVSAPHMLTCVEILPIVNKED